MKKSFICGLLAAVLILALAPCAFALEERLISSGDYVYMGEFNAEPIKWRVLDAQEMNTGEPGAYLLSEYVLDKHGTAFDEYIVGWQGSLAQEWCGSFCATALSEAEQNAVPAVTKHEDPKQLFGLRFGATELVEEKVFFLSAIELAEYIGDRDGAEGISAFTRDGLGAYWWLRTSHQSHPDYSGLVLEDNEVHDFLVYILWGCRPAMNLDYGKILNILPACEGADGEWKLTVSDGSENLKLGEVRVEDGILKADYSLTDFGQDRYISLVIRDADGALHSAKRLCAGDSPEGSVELNMDKEDIPQGGRLFLICEKDMGDYMTSYACQPVEIACSLSFDPGLGTGEMEPLPAAPGMGVTLPECGFTPPAGMTFDHWEADGQQVESGLRLSRNMSLTAVYKNITVSAISFDTAKIELELFKSTDLTATTEPADAMDSSLSWHSEPKGIVKVTDNADGSCSVKGRRPGTATVSAASNDGGAVGSVQVTVTGSDLAALAVNNGIYVLAVAFVAGLLREILKRKKKKAGDQKAD